MSIFSIYVYDNARESWTTVTGVLKLQTVSPDTVPLTVDVADDAVVLSVPKPDEIDVDQMALDTRDKLLNNHSVITSINGIAPAEDGSFFIDGSDCVSWTMVDPGTPDEPTDLSAETLESGALYLTDLCPSCDACTSIMESKKLAEYYKTLYNSFKDAILYTKRVANTRLHVLQAPYSVVPVGAGCQVSLEKTASTVSDLDIGQILAGYVHTVNMWNWAASTNTKGVEISTAPESASGISVQTKFALANCGPKNTVQLYMHIQCASDNDKLSIYMPELQAGQKFEYFTSPIIDAVDLTDKVVDESERLSKTLTLTFVPKKAATIICRVKCLPFKGVQLMLGSSTMPVDNGSGYVPPTSSTTIPHGGTDYAATEYMLSPDSAVELGSGTIPTAADYKGYNTYPSKSSDKLLTWTVNITWRWSQTSGGLGRREFKIFNNDWTSSTENDTAIQDPTELTYTYTFITRDVRDYMANVMSNSVLANITS